jgi:hypothetical protein
MSKDDLPRVQAPVEPEADVPTVPRGGGAPITEDAELQAEHVAPEGELTVDHTETAREVEQGYSPFGGVKPERPDRSTRDTSSTEGTANTG